MKKPETQKTKTVEPMRRAPAGKAIGKIEVAKAAAGTAVAEKAPKKPFNPVKFFTEVRQEAKRITWTTRKETWITTVMVMIMVVLAGLFFWLVDAGLGFLITYVTKIGQ